MKIIRDGSIYLIRFEEGERFPDPLLELLAAESITGASFTAIGAMQSCCIAFFDTDAREYRDIELDEQLEVLALIGNVAAFEDAPLVHAHVTLGRRDGTTLGGHLRYGIVRPTLELTLQTFSGSVRRTRDPKWGLPALDLPPYPS